MRRPHRDEDILERTPFGKMTLECRGDRRELAEGADVFDRGGIERHAEHGKEDRRLERIERARIGGVEELLEQRAQRFSVADPLVVEIGDSNLRTQQQGVDPSQRCGALPRGGYPPCLELTTQESGLLLRRQRLREVVGEFSIGIASALGRGCTRCQREAAPLFRCNRLRRVGAGGRRGDQDDYDECDDGYEYAAALRAGWERA